MSVKLKISLSIASWISNSAHVGVRFNSCLSFHSCCRIWFINAIHHLWMLSITCELILLFQPLLQCMLLLIPVVFTTRTAPTTTCVWFEFMVCFMHSMYQRTALYQLYQLYKDWHVISLCRSTLVCRWSQCKKHSSCLDTLSNENVTTERLASIPALRCSERTCYLNHQGG